MARKMEFLPTVTGNGFVPLDEIPQEVKNDIENMLKAQRKHDGRTRITFDSVDELKVWFSQAASYCAQRPHNLGGKLRIRKSPSRNLPDNVGDFKVHADIVANGKDAANAAKNH